MKCKGIGSVIGTSCKEIIIKVKNLLRVIRKEVSLTASITVEASIALPLFIFFFVNIMTMFNILKMQCDMEAALHQTGNEVALYAYDERFAEEIAGAEDSGLSTVTGALSIFYIQSKIEQYLRGEIDKSCVTGGSSGLSYINSRVMMGNDIIDIVVDYKVHPLISLVGFKDFPVESRYYAHAWTGYDISGMGETSQEEEMVYVTEHGEVYHRDINCKHLKLTVRTIGYESLGGVRNADGSKYYPCEYCGKDIAGGNVFITDYGNRYHSSVNCAGLKRKIYTIPISEVDGRPACSSCGG